MSLSSSPIITRMQVIPVAGYDSMLMTLSGAHAPCFTRNLVILQDSAGHTGIGEIHGGDYTCDCLNAIRPLVEGAPVACYRQVLQRIHKLTGAKENGAKGSDGIQTLDISKLKFVVRSEWAVECAMLDLMGQFVGQPLYQLLGEGRQRDKVEVLGYLFYVSDKAKYAGPGPAAYIDESGSADPHFWGFDGAVRMSQLLDAWGLTWGIHSNNHFDVTLAAFAHVGAAAVGDPAPIDTHWIWQDGQNLLDDTPQIAGGFLQVPEGPGLGVHLNMEKVTAANALYRRLPSHDRNDAAAMQYLIPGWTYDHKKPCLVR